MDELVRERTDRQTDIAMEGGRWVDGQMNGWVGGWMVG